MIVSYKFEERENHISAGRRERRDWDENVEKHGPCTQHDRPCRNFFSEESLAFIRR